MRKLFTILVAILLTVTVFAQSPEKMSYQAVVRNSNDVLVTSTSIGMQISILQTSTTGTAVYVERHFPTTNANGLVSIEIGTGTELSGNFTNIDWANDTYFIKTEIDLNGGANYTITGTSQLLSVAYALHAKTAESITGTITETDPTFTAWDKATGIVITESQITDLQSYLTTEVDPQFASWDKATGIVITENQISDLQTYLTAETDPTFTAWDKSTGVSITESQITDLQSYLTTEVDGSTTNEIQNLSEVLTESNNAGATNITNLTDPVNAQDAATKVYVDQMMQIMENNGLTVVDFTSDNTATTVDATVNFIDNSAINPTTWSWDFGDGNSSVIQNPTHAYTTAGTYTVSLTTSNGTITKTETKTNYITVNIDGSDVGLIDYDGNTYTSIIIGGQEWMAENLKVTHYPNGDAIPLVTDNTAWGNLANDNTSDAYSYFNNNASSEADTYGALYTYAAAIGDNWARDNTANQGVCPDGWHLPTDADWKQLEMALGMSQSEADGTNFRGTNEGSKLAGNTALWPNDNLENNAEFGNSGFSALPSGERYYTGNFYNLGHHGYWWSATEVDNGRAYFRLLYYVNTEVYRANFIKSSGYSVRCVRD